MLLLLFDIDVSNELCADMMLLFLFLAGRNGAHFSVNQHDCAKINAPNFLKVLEAWLSMGKESTSLILVLSPINGFKLQDRALAEPHWRTP